MSEPQHTILVVEDDPGILFGLRDNFQLAGYRVLSAVDGQLGLDLALKSRPDLVILDVMLPRLTGFEVLQEIRAKELDMPVVILTARGGEADVVKGLNLGADDYLTKPFSIQALIARVKNFLRRYRRPGAEVINFNGFELNKRSRQLTQNGEVVELTPKEYGLLEYMLDNVGRALTREQILNHVWGSDLAVTERSVDRCVVSLRAKIEEKPARPKLLMTVQKVGYRFEMDDLG
jgi:DNA-binding response OmpR family regulator